MRDWIESVKPVSHPIPFVFGEQDLTNLPGGDGHCYTDCLAYYYRYFWWLAAQREKHP
jgi:hypothetical protein